MYIGALEYLNYDVSITVVCSFLTLNTLIVVFSSYILIFLHLKFS